MRISDWSSDVCSSDLGAFEEDLDVLRDLVAALRIPLVEAVDIDVVIRAFAGLEQRGRAIGVGDTCRKAVLLVGKKGRSDPIRLAGKLQVYTRPDGTALCLRIDKGQDDARSQAGEQRGT